MLTGRVAFSKKCRPMILLLQISQTTFKRITPVAGTPDVRDLLAKRSSRVRAQVFNLFAAT